MRQQKPQGIGGIWKLQDRLQMIIIDKMPENKLSFTCRMNTHSQKSVAIDHRPERPGIEK
jgi:hypothetical protein